MKAFKLAVSLILVPRLFVSLILFPLLLSILIVFGQTFVTRIFMKSVESKSASVTQSMVEAKKQSLVRMILFGSGDPLPPPKVCRWISKPSRENGFFEAPPGRECAPDRLDAALHVPNPAEYDPSRYVELLNGSFERIHICKRDCKPDAVITPDKEQPRSDVYSFWGLALLHEARFSATTKQDFLDKLNEITEEQNLLGDRYLYTKGLRGAVSLKNLLYSMVIVMNLSMLIIIALWLALKAHRKVLDYFARSGALLPLVAATGKGTFYSALWILTFFRVGAFVSAAVPISVLTLLDGIPEDAGPLFGGIDFSELLLWMVAISISMGFATLIASIADLKHRHTVLSFCYKFLPLVISGVGAIAWGITFIVEGPTVTAVRDTITSLPLFGMAPILMAPIVKPKIGLFVIHTLLTTALLAVSARFNARWFAAHLEEL